MIERLATRSYGVVTRRELVGAGVTDAEIRHRMRKRVLLREHPGVFRVGHRAPSVEARYLAAVRACGDGAALRRLAAGHLFGLLQRRSAPMPEVAARNKRRVRGVRTQQARSLDARDVTVWRGIPVTTVPRTLVDLAAVLCDEELARACHEAGVKHDTTPRQVAAVLERCPRAPGRRRLRRILDGDDPITISRLEREFLRLVRAAALPLPVVNRPAGGRRVDCRWPDVPLTVELDGYRYHRSRRAWERDRRREREARARGDEFRRYTWGDVHEEPEVMLAELRPLLAPVLK